MHPILFFNKSVGSLVAPAAVWVILWLLLLVLDDALSLGNLALLMVLANAVASMWLRPTLSVVTSAVAVTVFNWSFVPPRFTFAVDIQQDVILLITMLVVSIVTSYLMELKRRAIDREAQHQLQARLAQEHVKTQQLRNTLLTSISHDYRTPLTTVMSSASVIMEQAGRVPSEKICQLATLIFDQAHQLHRMTSNTLQLARLDSQSVHAQRNWESAEEILGTVYLRAQRNHPQRKLETKISKNLPLLYCDAILINQLLDNLIENALEHSQSHTSLLIIARYADNELLISVQDHGCGIPDEWKHRVFDIFQRVESLSAPADGGARWGIGIGLAVCRAIAEVHKGSIDISDTPGGGATVTLRLPVHEQPLHPSELPR